MRDSLMMGIRLILSINQALDQDIANCMHFVHILITDGQDTSSQETLQQAAYAMSISARFPVSRCKTEIIGIDLRENPQATA